MLMTEELLKEKPWTAVCNMINNRFGYQLSPYTTKLISFNPVANNRVAIEIERKRSSRETNTVPVLENTSFTYKRLPLNYLTAVVTEIDGLELPVTAQEALQHLVNDRHWVITSEDLIPLILSDYSEAYTIQANPESLRFYGSVRVTVNNSNRKDLAYYSKFTFPNSNVLESRSDVSKFNGCYLITCYDFTEHREYLKTINRDTAYPDARRLGSLLNLVTGLEFVGSHIAEKYNITSKIDQGLALAEVVYNGLVIPKYSERKDTTHVLVIKLNPTFCTNVLGTLLIHYN